MGVFGDTIGEGVVRYRPATNSFWLFGGFYVCANFCENRSRNATVRVLVDGQTDTHTDANGFYNLSHAICYSYGTDKKLSTASKSRSIRSHDLILQLRR